MIPITSAYAAPCPFCGAAGDALSLIEEPAYGTYWQVQCACSARGPMHEAPGEALNLWNERKVVVV